MRIADKQIAQDHSVKYLLECDDQAMTEALYFRHHTGPHFCISSMIGCPEACRFCASGLYGMQRRMTADEIVTQVELMRRDIQAHQPHLDTVTHISYQGMGEPLLNYHHVIRSIGILKAQWPRVTAYSLSTVGVIRGLKKLLAEDTPSIDQLYISLHAADQHKRSAIIPMAQTNPIDALVQTGADFARHVGKPTIASYLLLDGFNDGAQDADHLLQLVDPAHYRVQLLVFNPIVGLPFGRVTQEKAETFCTQLRRGGLDAYVTLSHGRDIDAGCGQLRMQRRAPHGQGVRVPHTRVAREESPARSTDGGRL